LKAVVEDGAERGRLARRLTDTAGVISNDCFIALRARLITSSDDRGKIIYPPRRNLNPHRLSTTPWVAIEPGALTRVGSRLA